jgi:hypothetical protein
MACRVSKVLIVAEVAGNDEADKGSHSGPRLRRTTFASQVCLVLISCSHKVVCCVKMYSWS